MTCTRTVVVVILILLVAWVEVVGVGLDPRPAAPNTATTSLTGPECRLLPVSSKATPDQEPSPTMVAT
jgi:hypothetical protein